MKYYKMAFKNFVNFKGRASLSEYWYFHLFSLIFTIVTIIIDSRLGTKMNTLQLFDSTNYFIGQITFIYWFVTFIPAFALTVRRLHDIGTSGWFLLITVIPILGQIWLLMLLCRDSQEGTNIYGPSSQQTSGSVSEISSNKTNAKE